MAELARAIARRERRDLWILRFVDFVITLMLWLTVLGGKRVEITKRVQIDYQVSKSLVISSNAPREVFFRVSGPRAFLKEIEDRSLSVPIDLSNAKAGDYEVIIRDDMLDLPLGLKVMSISPDTIPIKLDKVATKRVPIRAVFAGQLPEGIKVIGVTMKPSTVEVRGAQTRLVTIDAVPTESISLTPNSLKQEFDVSLSLNDLPGVFVEQQVVRVVVELEGALSRRWFRNIEVGLKVGKPGGPDASARSVDVKALGVRMRPATASFMLEGPERLISSFKNNSIEVWAEIPDLKAGSYRSRLDWRLPPELRVVRRSTDWIDIAVPPK